MSRRRRLTAEFNVRVVLEVLTGIEGRTEICPEHRLGSQVLARWREELAERAPDPYVLI